jgi:hypothetical protein
MALQRNLKGARHLRLPDHRPPQPGLHPVHPAHAEIRRDNLRQQPRFQKLHGLLAAYIDEFR